MMLMSAVLSMVPFVCPSLLMSRVSAQRKADRARQSSNCRIQNKWIAMVFSAGTLTTKADMADQRLMLSVTIMVLNMQEPFRT